MKKLISTASILSLIAVIAFILSPEVKAASVTSISTDATSYQSDEPILISWSYGSSSDAHDGDWIGVYPDHHINDLSSGSEMWLWVQSLTQSYRAGVPDAAGGSVVFDKNGPVETGRQSWPLAAGKYRVFLIRSVAAPYAIVEMSDPFTVYDSQTQISIDQGAYFENDPIQISWSFADGIAQDGDWIAIYPENDGSTVLPRGSDLWIYALSGTQSYSAGIPPSQGSAVFGAGGVDESGQQSWPLPGGTYRAHILHPNYEAVASSSVFEVLGNVCPAAYEEVSANMHLAPSDADNVGRIAFSSCYKPSSQINDKLWRYLREDYCTDGQCVWAWLGDNMYMDSNNMDHKRNAYNAARNDQYYSSMGPIADPKIPVTGTWDDHDYAWNNMGKYYSCRQQSQNEFCHHFNVAESDPRHPSQGPNQQEGIYSSNLFNRPDGNPGGIHLINLDARYHRSPISARYGPCEGTSSSMLGDTQWQWLENELNRPSDVKVISSGIQVLPPTHKANTNSFCAYDGPSGTFVQANNILGEGDNSFSGTSYESWGEMPQERLKLLRLVQKSIADGNALQVIFISGDQHWAEISFKDIPSIGDIPTVRVHEVTASGIDQRWNQIIPNPNRLKLRETDSGSECALPFTYRGVVYDDCTTVDHHTPWCYTVPDDTFGGRSWGNCLPASMYSNIVSSKKNICGGDASHVCTAQANFGGISVDWEEQSVTLSILTPHDESAPVAASVSFAL
mmetsp:Transcript_33855/g.49377  ORF Transcript_33855/g.49377 Transcript_33855/m.49377 type:complete len:733 (-) Transcript_33855:349-2547(-)